MRARNVIWGESDGYAGIYGLNGKKLRSVGWLAAAWTTIQSSAAMAQDSLADPQGSGAIVSAVRWLQGTLLGTVATVVAVIAVASVGFLMLTGRINWRYGATVILGCFILFGAASIVAGIQSTASAGY
ncbi:MAG: type secretion protein [Sphingomonas bacterium]|nr:type secretion protein [Sphingomonas bacterium]